MSSFTQPTIALQTTMTLIMLGLIFAVLVDPYMDSRRSRFMMGVVGVVFLLFLQNRWEYLLELSGEFPYRRMLVSMLGYILRPVVLALLFYIISNMENHKTVWVLILVNTAVHLTALFLKIPDEKDTRHFLASLFILSTYKALIKVATGLLTFDYVEGMPVVTAWAPRTLTGVISIRRALKAFD